MAVVSPTVKPFNIFYMLIQCNNTRFHTHVKILTSIPNSNPWRYVWFTTFHTPVKILSLYPAFHTAILVWYMTFISWCHYHDKWVITTPKGMSCRSWYICNYPTPWYNKHFHYLQRELQTYQSFFYYKSIIKSCTHSWAATNSADTSSAMWPTRPKQFLKCFLDPGLV